MSSVLYHPGVRSISLIFLEVGIPNLVCIFILGWRNVTYNFQVTVTLTSDLVLRTIVSGVYLILFEIGIANLVCGCILGWWSVAYHLRVTVTLTSELIFRIIMSGIYLLYYLWWESQIWCVDASLGCGLSSNMFGSL